MECFVSVKCASQCQCGYLLADGSIIYFCFQYDAVDLYLNLKVPNSRVFALAEKQLHVKCYYYHFKFSLLVYYYNSRGSNTADIT